MRDFVLDATVVAFSNLDLNAPSGGRLVRSLNILRCVVNFEGRVRYNNKLRREYEAHVRQRRNDIIEAFFAILDSPRAIRVTRSTLSASDHGHAQRARWPNHDQHLLAARDRDH